MSWQGLFIFIMSNFNREYYFPHVQVFADRNRVEKEETFELPAAARDRFLMELNLSSILKTILKLKTNLRKRLKKLRCYKKR